jgi:hypothetical protein
MPDIYTGEAGTDVTAPVVTNNTPTGSYVSRATDIEFDISDTGSGVDSTTITVTVDGNNAIVNGVFQAGYVGSIVGTAASYHVTINPDSDLPNFSSVPITVDADDLEVPPNAMLTFNWSFTTDDTTVPFVTSNSPTGSGVAVTALVEFDLSDAGTGVDLGSVDVTIGGASAFAGSKFQTGFDGPASDLDDSGAPNVYGFTIDASPDYAEYTTYETIVNASDFRVVPEPVGPASTFAWRMNEGGTPDEYADYGINNRPLISNSSPPPESTNPGFGPYSNVRRPTGDALETTWFDGIDVTWPADKVWISWWMRPKNLLNWTGGANQQICDVLAAVNTPPYTSFQLRKDGSQIEYRFYTSAGSSGFRNFTLNGLDPTKWHLFGLFLDGATGDYGLYYNLTQVHSLNIGGPCTLGHGQPGASDLRLRCVQGDCDIFELFVENRIYTPTEWANKHARYPG